MSAQETDTLIDVVMYRGQLMKKVLRNGEVEYEAVEEVGGDSLTDRFADTDMAPQTLGEGAVGGALIPTMALTRKQHVDRSCRIEAALVKALSPRMKDSNGVTDTIDTKGNGALRELLQDLCRAMGGDYLKYVDKIK